MIFETFQVYDHEPTDDDIRKGSERLLRDLATAMRPDGLEPDYHTVETRSVHHPKGFSVTSRDNSQFRKAYDEFISWANRQGLAGNKITWNVTEEEM